jgi:MFS superfamily sulfate permease-like transporter
MILYAALIIIGLAVGGFLLYLLAMAVGIIVGVIMTIFKAIAQSRRRRRIIRASRL